MATFQGEPGLADFIGAKDNGIDGDNWSYKTCKAPVKCHHQQTKTELFTGQMPFLSPNQQCQSTGGKIFPGLYDRSNFTRPYGVRLDLLISGTVYLSEGSFVRNV